ncbi:MAG: ferrous iron transport protein A [Thiotrichaceae bacterium]|nr:ferrous iron transport protein A [Thiotrichaceae bacterium]
MITIGKMAIGDTGKVTGIQKGNKSYRKKLLAMGLTPGTKFNIIRYAPMGDPIEIHVRGFALTLRKDEAATLLVERIST